MKTHPTTPTPLPDPIVPLLLVAGEIGVNIDDLASRCRSAIVVDGAGIRCLPVGVARQVIDDHHVAVAAARERERLDRLEASQRTNPVVDRVRALKRAQHGREGIQATTAAEIMMAGDR